MKNELNSKCTIGKCMIGKCTIGKCMIAKCMIGKCMIAKCMIGKNKDGKCMIGKCIIVTKSARLSLHTQGLILALITLHKEERRIDTCELWCYRRMQKLSWTDNKSNVEELRSLNTEKELIKGIKNNNWSISDI